MSEIVENTLKILDQHLIASNERLLFCHVANSLNMVIEKNITGCTTNWVYASYYFNFFWVMEALIKIPNLKKPVRVAYVTSEMSYLPYHSFFNDKVKRLKIQNREVYLFCYEDNEILIEPMEYISRSCDADILFCYNMHPYLYHRVDELLEMCYKPYCTWISAHYEKPSNVRANSYNLISGDIKIL